MQKVLDMTMNMYIIMNMNIYIQEDNQKLLQQYKDSGKSMSALINALIMEHFVNPDSGKIEFWEAPLMLRDFYKRPTDKELTALYKYTAPSEVQFTKVCKIHRTPLTNFGKCLQKGCKYA